MYKIILADDEVLIREAISENIEWNSLGFDLVGTCENGKQVVEMIKKEEPDLVITDICMPFMDGIDVARYVYENAPKCRVMIISGYDNFEYAKKAIRYQVMEYVLKPVTAQELSSTLEKIRQEFDREQEKERQFQKIKEAYEQNRQYFRERFLNQLIRGKKSMKEIERQLRFYDIALTGECFSVVQIEFLISENQTDLLLFALYNITEELMRKKSCVVFQDMVNVTTVIFAGESEYQLERDIQREGNKIQDTLQRYLKEPTMIVAGKCVTNLGELFQSYDNVKQTQEYRFLFEENAVIFGREFTKRNERDSFALSDWPDRFAVAVKKNDSEEIKRKVTRFFGEIRRSRMTRTRVSIYCQNIIMRLLLLADELGVDESVSMEWEHAYLEEASRKERLEDVEELMISFCLKMAESISRDRDDFGKNMSVRALEFIDKNYRDSALSLQSVCKALAISSSYFSALFKSQTGETFIEALTRKRMEAAKELLASTDMKTYEVAEEVGYSDAHYFGSIFKKNTGLTPKEYARKWSRL